MKMAILFNDTSQKDEELIKLQLKQRWDNLGAMHSCDLAFKSHTNNVNTSYLIQGTQHELNHTFHDEDDDEDDDDKLSHAFTKPAQYYC